MHTRQTKTMFLLSVSISSIILLQMGYYLCSILGGWDVRFNFIAVCHSWLKIIGLSFLEYVLDALVLYTLFYLIWQIFSQWLHTVRMKKQLAQYMDHQLTIKMNAAYSQGEKGLLVVSYPAPIAITIGFIHPKIVLSTGLMHLLDGEELEAVIAHEMAHQKKRDPLKLFVMTLCSSVMWYIPVLKWFNQQYKILKELAADEYAVEKQKTTLYIGSALLKMLQVGQAEKMPFTYASFADTSVNYRIDYMLNPFKERQLSIPLRILLRSIAMFSFICSLFISALTL